jgi:flagellar biosynthetic protein FliR
MDLMTSEFLLVLARLSPLFLITSLTPFSWVPLTVRVVLAGATALMVGTVSNHAGIVLDTGQPWLFAFALLQEVAAGLSLALAVVIPGAAIGFSARLVDVQSGMAAASLLNPATHVDESLVQLVLRWAASIVFFITGLHVMTLQAFVASFAIAPAGNAHILTSVHGFMLLLSSQFLLGLLIAAPVVVGLFAVDIVIGHISRSMPQANIYFVGLPVKLAATLVLLAVSLRNVPSIVVVLYRDAFGAIAHGAA